MSDRLRETLWHLIITIDAQLGNGIQEISAWVQGLNLLWVGKGAEGEAEGLEHPKLFSCLCYILPACPGRSAHFPPQALALHGTGRSSSYKELSIAEMADTSGIQHQAAPTAHGNATPEQFDGAVVFTIL